jgi:hypothetical protein
MKGMSKHLMTTLGIIALLTLVAQVPAFEDHFLIPITTENPHLLTIAEGIGAGLLAWWASRADEVKA